MHGGSGPLPPGGTCTQVDQMTQSHIPVGPCLVTWGMVTSSACVSPGVHAHRLSVLELLPVDDPDLTQLDCPAGRSRHMPPTSSRS